MTPDDFIRDRNRRLDRILVAVDARARQGATRLIQLQEKHPDAASASAEREIWLMLYQGVLHLRSGAPDGGPGSLAEALTRVSLRASPLAAALGVPAPQFEPILLSVDYTGGDEAAAAACRQLIDCAEGDFPKSRQIIQQKIIVEKPGVDAVKEQMALAFAALAEAYPRLCREMKALLPEI